MKLFANLISKIIQRNFILCSRFPRLGIFWWVHFCKINEGPTTSMLNAHCSYTHTASQTYPQHQWKKMNHEKKIVRNIESKCINKFNVIKFECNMLYICKDISFFFHSSGIFMLQNSQNKMHIRLKHFWITNGKWNETKQNDKLNAKTFHRNEWNKNF